MLIEVVVLKAAHTHRERVRRQVAKSSRERQMAGYAKEELSFAAHAACGNAERRRRAEAQSGGAEGCITQERQRQCAASHKSVVHWQSRIAHAKITNDAGSRKEKGPNSLKFVRGETYHILVSEPLTRRASAIAVMPSAV